MNFDDSAARVEEDEDDLPRRGIVLKINSKMSDKAIRTKIGGKLHEKGCGDILCGRIQKGAIV